MLDLELEGLPGIVNSITNQMVDDKQFDADKRHFVNSALLLKHIHNNPEPQGNAFKRRLSSIRRMSTRTVDSVRKLSLRPESRAAIANRSMSMAAAAGGGGGTGVAGATVPTGRSGSTAAAPTPLPTPIRSGNFLSVSADGVNLANRPQLQPQSRGGQLGVNGRADFLNGGGDAATTATTTTPAAAALNFKKDL